MNNNNNNNNNNNSIIIIIILLLLLLLLLLSTKEPTGLLRDDRKRPDGLTLVPWQSGLSFTWDVTVVDTLASSYPPISTVTPCGAAEVAAKRKRTKYAEVIHSHIFVPIAIETLEPINMDGKHFLDSLGERLSSVSGATFSRATIFQYQRLSVLIQILNWVAFRGTLLPETVTES